MQHTKSRPHITDATPSVTFKFTSSLPMDDCIFHLKNSVWKASPFGYKTIKVQVNKRSQEFRVIWYEDPRTPGTEVTGHFRKVRGNKTLVSGKAYMIRNKYPQAWLYGALIGLLGILMMLALGNTFVLFGFGMLYLWMMQLLWNTNRKHKILIKAIKTAVENPKSV